MPAVSLTLTARLPAIISAREFVQAGVLMSYGPNFPDMRLGGGKIDGEVEFGRLLDRDIPRLSATQNLVDDFGSAPEQRA
jgi:hypothetical protein